MWILIVIILALVAVMVYAFVVVPALGNYRESQQIEGYNIAISQLTQQLAQQAISCQTIPLAIGNNQTVNLIAVECLQQQPAQ